jgi:hypothetical protein
MRIPKEDLKDFTYFDVVKNRPDPPAKVTLHPSGEFEDLKPLAVWDGPLETDLRAGSYFSRLSEFHRTLALTGASAALAVAIGTALWLNAALSEHIRPIEVAADQETAETTLSELSTDDPELLSDSDTSFFSAPDASIGQPAPARSVYRKKRRYAPRPAVRFAADRVKRRPLIKPQFIVSEFVPTRLLIFVENGEIKTRIEPQLSASFKRPATLPN